MDAAALPGLPLVARRGRRDSTLLTLPMRTFFLLAAGLAVGYWYGFRDAQTHTAPLQRRVAGELVQKAGGASRSRVQTDVDAQMRRVER